MINKKNVFVICFLFLNKNNIYASSVSNFLGIISPNAISSLYHKKPVDLVRNGNNKFFLLRIPYNNEIAGDNDELINFPEYSRRSEPVGELVTINETSLKSYVFRDDLNINNIYRKRVSVFVNKDDPYQPSIEFFLRNDIEETEEETENDSATLAILIGCLQRYERQDIVDKLRQLNFFR